MAKKSVILESGHRLWYRYESIQWACVLMELLGESSLEYLPLLMSGSKAPQTSFQCNGHMIAINNTRRLLSGLLTRRAVQKAVRDLYAHAEKTPYDPSYVINEQTLHFYPAQGQGARIAAAKKELQQPLSSIEYGLRLAEPGDLIVRLHKNTSPVHVSLRLPALTAEKPQQHDLSRVPDKELSVSLSQLKAIAIHLDRIDQENTHLWKAENWLARLQGISFKYTSSAGLKETDRLDLTQLKHIIGLPGAGKTTLISLLCIYLAGLNKRIAVFFSSIETARGYLEKLTRYSVKTALLVGRSLSTHRRHGDALAELVAVEGEGGFTYTRTGTDLLAQTCPLPAYAVDETIAWNEWWPGEAPCEQLYEPNSETPRLCPLWSSCGRVKNQRDLVKANIWLGHIRSADTPVPAHTSPERLQYFELIGNTFDLVVFDEVDETQNVLDGLGALTLDLSGTADSLHIKSQRVTGLSLMGDLSLRESRLLNPHNYAANTFERHLIRFYEEVYRIEKDLSRDLEGRLLTTHYLIRMAIRQVKPSLKSDYRSAVYTFWDTAMYRAFFRDKKSWSQAGEIGAVLGINQQEAQSKWQELVSSFSDYLHALADDDSVEETVEALITHFATLLGTPAKKEVLAPMVRVLVAVGFAVAAYQKLARIARPLSQFGILKETAIQSDASDSLRRKVPHSLLGSFSSVRYRSREEGNGIVMDYLVLDCTPRLLLHRLHEMGTNVLLMSATSYMPDSPAFHVDVLPTYILSPKQLQKVNITMHFEPIKLPTRKEALYFSGAGREQVENLKKMVDHLAAKKASGLSPLERTALAMRTSQGRERKCALVVNSYEQVQQVVEQIARSNSSLALRTRGIVKTIPSGFETSKRYVLKGQVETLGYDEQSLVLVFPLTALSRGINIIFSTTDTDNGAAAIGSIYFLIRPHPVAGDLTLMLSTIAQVTQRFDLLDYHQSTLREINEAYLKQRHALHSRIMGLLARPLSASKLPEDFLRPFSANLFIPILQMIGRAIRKSSPAEIYFIDAAWAPLSAKGEADNERTSVLVNIRKLLMEYLSEKEPSRKALLDALYGPFAQAFFNIEGLQIDEKVSSEEDEADRYTFTSLEDLGDLA